MAQRLVCMLRISIVMTLSHIRVNSGGGKIVKAFVTNNTENGDITEALMVVSLNGFQGATPNQYIW